MIRAERLEKRFLSRRGRTRVEVHAVRGVSFDVADGAITGLLGPNGAGKTTALRMIAALLVPDGGDSFIDGTSVAADRRTALARMGILSDARGLYHRLSARENIQYYGRLRGLSDDQIDAAIDRLAGPLDLRGLLDRRTEGASQGERMKIALARALVHDPPNVVLDEPTNGLDIRSIRALREWLRELRRLGKCVLFSTHVMQEVAALCDRVVILSEGRTIADGTIDSILAAAGKSDLEEAFVALAYGATSA